MGMTREEKEQTGKYVLQMARLLEDGCYQQEMLLKAVHIIDEALEQEPILDKIREDFIARYPRNYANELELGGRSCVFSLNDILNTIDKYKLESEKN